MVSDQGVWYCTRQQVKRALDSAETARNNAQVDRCIEASSRAIERLCRRRFYPALDTRYLDWPNRNQRGVRSETLYLDERTELISLTTLTSGGTTIGADGYNLEPINDGPPYTRLEINLASSSAFSSGDTYQRSVAMLGLFGGCPLDELAAGATAEALDTSETGVNVTDASALGVGSILRVETERMIVIGQAMLTSGQTISGNLNADLSGRAVGVSDGTLFAVGEVIAIDTERMLIVDIIGNSLVVRRGWDGSGLATHTLGATVYAERTLTVRRGALGTTAASHDTAATVYRFEPPPPVNSLAIAETLNRLGCEVSQYARTTGGENAREMRGVSLAQLRKDVATGYGRGVRHRAV